MVNLDIAKTDEQFQQCAALLAVTHPNDPPPDFGNRFSTTFIVYDTELPEKVQGVIHVDALPIIRSMSIDPDYKLRKAAFILLHQTMEAHLRIAGYPAVLHDVPKTSLGTIDTLKKCGSVEVPFGRETDVRLKKEL